MIAHTGAWWEDHREICRFLRWIHERDMLDATELLDIVEKPWHWDREYGEMCSLQAEARAEDVEREMQAEAGQSDDELSEMINDCEDS